MDLKLGCATMVKQPQLAKRASGHGSWLCGTRRSCAHELSSHMVGQRISVQSCIFWGLCHCRSSGSLQGGQRGKRVPPQKAGIRSRRHRSRRNVCPWGISSSKGSIQCLAGMNSRWCGSRLRPRILEGGRTCPRCRPRCKTSPCWRLWQTKDVWNRRMWCMLTTNGETKTARLTKNMNKIQCTSENGQTCHSSLAEHTEKRRPSEVFWRDGGEKKAAHQHPHEINAGGRWPDGGPRTFARTHCPTTWTKPPSALQSQRYAFAPSAHKYRPWHRRCQPIWQGTAPWRKTQRLRRPCQLPTCRMTSSNWPSPAPCTSHPVPGRPWSPCSAAWPSGKQPPPRPLQDKVPPNDWRNRSQRPQAFQQSTSRHRRHSGGHRVQRAAGRMNPRSSFEGCREPSRSALAVAKTPFSSARMVPIRSCLCDSTPNSDWSAEISPFRMVRLATADSSFETSVSRSSFFPKAFDVSSSKYDFLLASDEASSCNLLIRSVIKSFTFSSGSSPAPAPNFIKAEVREASWASEAGCSFLARCLTTDTTSNPWRSAAVCKQEAECSWSNEYVCASAPPVSCICQHLQLFGKTFHGSLVVRRRLGATAFAGNLRGDQSRKTLVILRVIGFRLLQRCRELRLVRLGLLQLLENSEVVRRVRLGVACVIELRLGLVE